MPSLFQSISSLFSSQRDVSHIRRDQAMVSVDDAFTVPSDAEYVTSPTAYTYPPPAQGTSYDTVPQSLHPHSSYDPRPPPSSSGTRSRPASLLPIHHSPLSPLPSYPPLLQTWNRLRSWLDDQYPELADTLNWGIQPPDLAHLELQLGFALPPAVRDSYLVVDGQEAESSAGCSEGLFFGLTLLPFEDVVDEWRFWREVDDDPATGANVELRESMRSIPPGWIRREYSQRGWLPLVADKAGNYLGVDMNPDERGAIGQVIVFGRDFDTKVVMWRGHGEAGWACWLASFVEELESGEGFELGGSDGSEGSEDDVGYESYFFDGSGQGKGQGGGEGGSGGLRLTGDYKGWTVLEALADRSMKRWVEAGVMLQPTHIDDSGSSSNIAEFPVLDTESDNASQSNPQSNGDPSSLHTHTHTLSITKAPAPQPVPLPTERDLLPSPTYSSPTENTPVYEHDGSLPMREVDRTTPVQANFAPSVKEATLVPLPSSSSGASPPKSPSPTPMVTHSEAPNPQSTDSLLSNSHSPLVDAISIHSTATILTSTPVDLSDPRPSESQVVNRESQRSVRLVGGGGISGDALLVDDVLLDSSKLHLPDNVSSGSSRKLKKEAV